MTRSRGILPPRHHWTDAEIALLRAMYPDCHGADVAAWTGHTLNGVYQAAKKHGVEKSAEYLASDTACRIQRGKQSEAMIATRFKKGQPSWTKGTKGLVGVQEACRANHFKKGEMSGAAQRNYKPIGTLRINADGVLERKVTDDPSLYPARRWVPVSRLVWEAAKGPIPVGCVVRFKPGLATTDPDLVTLDRLECISKGENMRRNSVHTVYPPEVARLVQLRGALNRQINARTRAMEEA